MGITSEQARIAGKLGGRKKGFKIKATLEREKVKKHFDQRVLRLQDRLLNSQASLAIGQTFLYKIEKEWVKTGTNKKTGEDNGYWKNLKPKIVTSQREIEDYLEMLAENNGQIDDDQDEGATYYFLTTKEPESKAIDSLLDRVHGKAKESVEVTGEIKFSLKQLADRRKELNGPKNDIIDAVVVEKETDNVSSEEI